MAIYINNTDIATYGARMVDYSVSGVPYTDNYVKTPNNAFPVRFNGLYGLREIGLTLDFVAVDRETAESNISAFVAACIAGCELLLPDGYYYTCVFGQADAPKHVAAWISQTVIKLLGVRHGALVTSSSMTSETTLSVSGNIATPARVEISGITGNCSVTINGEEITITGVTGSLIIDGIEKTVMSNNNNVFNKTNLTAFPSLNVGNNVISMTNGLTVIVKYYPLYV